MSAFSSRVTIWDPFIRVFHWLLVFLVISNLFLTEEGDEVHQWFGYIALGAVLLRGLWGLVGPYNARFKNFFPSLSSIAKHLDELKSGSVDPKSGHNPLGALMVLALLFLVLCLGLTGYLLEEVDMFFGEEWLEEIHESLAEILQVLVAVHVVAIVIMQKILGFDLVKPMITGKRNLD